jgi:N-acetylmuramoyl-L-alanine amidase
MKTLASLFLLLLVSSLHAQAPVEGDVNYVPNQAYNNLRVLVKDTALYQDIIRGRVNIPAIESGLQARKFSYERELTYPIRIAIDPGHMASNKREAILEERFIRAKKIFFYEAKLAMATALLVEESLRKAGFHVMLTREWGKTALDMTYDKWYRRHRCNFLRRDLEAERITQDQFDRFTKLKKKELFWQYFTFLELRQRIEKINLFQADLTLIIHFNASEFRALPHTSAPRVEDNYTVFFIPGGFTTSEINSDRWANDIQRLTASDQIGLSQFLSATVANEFIRAFRVAPLDTPSTIPWVNKFAVRTHSPGVFGRNLYLTRAINSPLCYAEPFLQNNTEMIDVLNRKDFSVGPVKGVPPVLKTVADCYVTGIKKYLQEGQFFVTFGKRDRP